mgnify:CR=1 FL=1
MAEENVFIEGLGPNVPQWSTEQTLQQIKSLLAGEGALTQEVSKKLDNVVKGGQDTVAVLRETVLGAKENKKATQDLKQEVAKGNGKHQEQVDRKRVSDRDSERESLPTLAGGVETKEKLYSRCSVH